MVSGHTPVSDPTYPFCHIKMQLGLVKLSTANCQQQLVDCRLSLTMTSGRNLARCQEQMVGYNKSWTVIGAGGFWPAVSSKLVGCTWRQPVFGVGKPCQLSAAAGWLHMVLSWTVIGAGKPGQLSAAASCCHGGAERLAARPRHRDQQGRTPNPLSVFLGEIFIIHSY